MSNGSQQSHVARELTRANRDLAGRNQRLEGQVRSLQQENAALQGDVVKMEGVLQKHRPDGAPQEIAYAADGSGCLATCIASAERDVILKKLHTKVEEKRELKRALRSLEEELLLCRERGPSVQGLPAPVVHVLPPTPSPVQQDSLRVELCGRIEAAEQWGDTTAVEELRADLLLLDSASASVEPHPDALSMASSQGERERERDNLRRPGLERTVAALREEVETLHAALRKKESNTEENSIAAFARGDDARIAAEQRCADLEAKLASLTQDLSELHQLHEDAHNDATEQARECTAVTAEKEQCLLETETLRAECNTLREECASLQATVRTLRGDLGQKETDLVSHKSQEDSLFQTAALAQQREGELMIQLEEMKSQKAKEEQSGTSMKLREKDLREEVAALKAALAQRDDDAEAAKGAQQVQWRQREEELAEVIEKLKTELREMRATLSRRDDDVARLKADAMRDVHPLPPIDSTRRNTAWRRTSTPTAALPPASPLPHSVPQPRTPPSPPCVLVGRHRSPVHDGQQAFHRSYTSEPIFRDMREQQQQQQHRHHDYPRLEEAVQRPPPQRVAWAPLPDLETITSQGVADSYSSPQEREEAAYSGRRRDTVPVNGYEQLQQAQMHQAHPSHQVHQVQMQQPAPQGPPAHKQQQQPQQQPPAPQRPLNGSALFDYHFKKRPSLSPTRSNIKERYPRRHKGEEEQFGSPFYP